MRVAVTVGLAIAAAALLVATAGAATGRVGPTQRQETATPSAQVPADLPLVEKQASTPSRTLALIMSGDGNWARFIREVGDSVAAHGVSVVGLESRTYLSRPKTPDQVAADMEAVLRYYLSTWSADSVLVIGYSRGADFAPFVVNRLAPDVRARVAGVALLSPSRSASFEFHFLDLLRTTPRSSDLPMLSEVERMHPLPILCVYGVRDPDSLCPSLPPSLSDHLLQDRGHRLGDAVGVARSVLRLSTLRKS